MGKSGPAKCVPNPYVHFFLDNTSKSGYSHQFSHSSEQHSQTKLQILNSDNSEDFVFWRVSKNGQIMSLCPLDTKWQ